MRTRAFIHGAFFGYLYQGVVILAGLWLTPFLLRHLGQDDYGRWLICLQILSYAMLADFGTVAVLPRDIAYASGEADPAKRNLRLRDLVGRTGRVVLAQTVLVVAASLISLLFYRNIPAGFKGPVILMLAGFALLFPLRIFPAVLEGLQQLRAMGQIRMAAWFVSTAVICVSVLLGFRMYSLAFGWIVTQLGGALGAWLWLRKREPPLAAARTLMSHGRMTWRDLFRGSWISVSQLAQVLWSGTDLMIVGKVLGPAAVVVYSCTGKLLSVLANQPAILIHTALPGLSQMRVSESREKLLKVSTAMGQGMLILSGLIGVVVLSVNEPFVRLWVGTRFYGGSTITLLFVLTTVLRQVDLCFSVALFAFGHEKTIALKTLAGGFFGVAAGWLLSRWLGAVGIAAGFLGAAVVIAIPANVYILARECQVSWGDLLRPYWPWFWRFCVVGSAAAGISAAGWVNSVGEAAAAGAVTALLYFAAVATFIGRSELWPYLKPVLLRGARLFGSPAEVRQRAL